jgi:ABC-type nitrate/sulfonate/bicarbonate transport system permease component
VVAALVAFGLALIAVLVPRLAGAVYTGAVVVSSIPLIALTPVLVLWLDRGDAVRTAVAALAGVFPILVGCVQGLRATDARAEELFVQLAARPAQRFRLLALPSSLPYVFAGLKAAAAAAVLGAIIAEWSGGGGTRGLGQMMTNALFGFNVAQTWLTILAAALLAVGFYATASIVERLVVRWEHDLVDGAA